jgi:hypothetical protein
VEGVTTVVEVVVPLEMVQEWRWRVSGMDYLLPLGWMTA